jgi:hypothetical protein
VRSETHSPMSRWWRIGGTWRLGAGCIAMVAVALASAAPADARSSRKKAIWGPVEVNGVSQFPIYKDLGVGIYETGLRWHEVATRRPLVATDPADPAYAWPAELDRAVASARTARIRVALMIKGSPAWANGGRSQEWAPTRVQDFADFALAAARRYPTVRLWLVWGEPSRAENFRPLTHETRDRPLNREQARAPRLYARMLDAAYTALKRANRANLVVGGNTFTTGDISPRNWIRFMRLPDGRRPRMDLYGHNPFTARRPNLAKPPLGHGFADFSDLDTLAGWLDRYFRHRRQPLRIFLSEFLIPSDHPNYEFDFYVDRRTQAEWLTAALRIARSWKRIFTLGWFSLYDDPPNARGDQVNRGLLDYRGRRKPAYFAYRRG